MVPEVIVVPIDGRPKLVGWGEQENHVRDWQIEEFLRQTGNAESTWEDAGTARGMSNRKS